MKPVTFAVPGDPETRTGGYRYDARVTAELRRLGYDVAPLRLADGFPHPEAADLDAAFDALAAVPAARVLLVDGLAFGALPAERLRNVRAPLVALVHHPLACETGLSAEAEARLAASERAALSRAAALIATSAATARLLVDDYGVPPARITVAEPGTDPAGRARGGQDGVIEIVCLGALVPRKGQDALVAALSEIADRPWRCRIAGPARDAAFAERLSAMIADARLQDRVHLLGEIDDQARDDLLDQADLFVLPSRFEGYGMAFAEALARGLPIVALEGAAVSVPAGAACLVRTDGLGRAIAALIDDSAARAALAGRAWAAGSALPRWTDTARAVADAIEGAAV